MLLKLLLLMKNQFKIRDEVRLLINHVVDNLSQILWRHLRQHGPQLHYDILRFILLGSL
jgi:hypothetical protein